MNTLNAKNVNEIPNKAAMLTEMDIKTQPQKCNELENYMINIREEVELTYEKSLENIDEKTASFCQALLQLLQSLKALESAPTKKYDFYSLYRPFFVLVNILESSIPKQKDLGEIAEIYNFIHKISMTLHGTLRTDIQFLQIRDFNVVVHYAPAKLRSFYTIWVFELSDFYKKLGMKNCNNIEYSFIFSPGMFGEVHVEEFLLDDMKQKISEDLQAYRLMLITVPERKLYSPRWLLIILAHEISHFVGRKIRQREKRHDIWREISARVIELEIKKFVYDLAGKNIKDKIESYLEKDIFWLNNLIELLCFREKANYPDGVKNYHSYASKEILEQAYREIGLFYEEDLSTDYAETLRSYLNSHNGFSTFIKTETDYKVEVGDYYVMVKNCLPLFFQKYQVDMLDVVIELIKYISAEAFADMMAILTLELMPEEYIKSFVYDTSSSKQKEDVTVLQVRICVVIEAIKNIVSIKENTKLFANASFCSTWKKDVPKTLKNELDKHSVEQDLILQVLAYRDGISAMDKQIRQYDCLYNISTESFDKSSLGYLNDIYVFQRLKEYISLCGQTYMQQLGNVENENARIYLQKTYGVVANQCSVDMIQEIENFLEKYEQKVNGVL